jgi:glutamate-1-semialdehyde 2,1-aminomutase
VETIVERYERLHPGSRELHERARAVFPDGVTHDIRHFAPFPVYVDRARGSRKWDVDGNEIVDYVIGHGALLLGHLFPSVQEAVARQLGLGTHLGASHALEVRWGELVQELVPSAERLRFTSSGTEATQMAVRIARAFTGRDRLIRFEAHFHGWNDAVTGALRSEDAELFSPGIPSASLRHQLILPQNDVDALASALEQHRDTIAAVIMEPTGASYGTNPVEPGFPGAVRELTERAGVPLIFDEVVTGFRASPGGAQHRFGIRPDLTCLAKVLAGGLPGGAVAGRADMLDQISFGENGARESAARIAHPGTFNANPLSAAAGIACLEAVATGSPNAAADLASLRLARGMNRVMAARGVPGCVFGYSSMLHILLGVPARRPEDGITYEWTGGDRRIAPRTSDALTHCLRRAMLNEGVDLMRAGALVSAVHTDEDVDFTIDAFDRALFALRRQDLL